MSQLMFRCIVRPPISEFRSIFFIFHLLACIGMTIIFGVMYNVKFRNEMADTQTQLGD